MGYIKVDRRITEWEWFNDGNVLKVWLYLLVNAQYHDTRYQGIEVKRGQLITGRKKLAERLGMSERQIRTCLERLKSTNELTIKTTNKYSVITIVKYAYYQGIDDESDQQSDQQNDQRTTNKRPTNDHNTRSIKNIENIENTYINNSASSIYAIPLNVNGTYHYVDQAEVDYYTELYPAVDVHQEFRKMIGWCNSHKAQRKTAKGVDKFINGWLAREQDKGRPKEKKMPSYDTAQNQEISKEEERELLQLIGKA